MLAFQKRITKEYAYHKPIADCVFSSFRYLASTDFSNSVDPVSFPPVPAVPEANGTGGVVSAGGVVSLEVMLFKGSLEYDFDITLVKNVVGIFKVRSKESAIQKVLVDYRVLFDQLLTDPDNGNFGLKLNFYVIRLKSSTLLVERLIL